MEDTQKNALAELLNVATQLDATRSSMKELMQCRVTESEPQNPCCKETVLLMHERNLRGLGCDCGRYWMRRVDRE